MPTRRNNSNEKEIHEGHIIKSKEFIKDLLFLEETTKLVHHAAAAAAIGGWGATVLGTTVLAIGGLRRTRFPVVPVLLGGIFGNATNDGSTNCSKESVIGLVASETTGGTTGEGTSKTTLALLCLWAICPSLLWVITNSC